MKTVLFSAILAMFCSGTLVSGQSEPQSVPGPECLGPMAGSCWMAAPMWAQVDDTMQPGRRQGGPHHHRGGPPGMMPQRRHLEQFRMLKLLELLDLDQEQEGPFLIAFNDIRSRLRELGKNKHEMLTGLADGLRDSSLSESEIDGLIEKLRQNEAARREAMDRFLGKAESILNPYQFGKLVVFQERFERQLLEHLREFRNRRMGHNTDNKR